jgi:hypothetical protein
MLYSFRLLKLLRSKINYLEKLRCLEMRLRSATVDKKSNILEQINLAVGEITQADRLIRDHKASYLKSGAAC